MGPPGKKKIPYEIKDARNTSCVRISMHDAIRARFEEAESVGEWSLPIDLPSIPLD